MGSDTTVQAGLERLVSDTHANEVIIVTDTYEHSDRIDSYERVARIAKKHQAGTKYRGVAFTYGAATGFQNGRKLRVSRNRS